MLENEEKKDLPKLHSKRLAREVAMQYLFSCDMNNDLVSVSAFNKFFEEELKAEHELKENRYATKGKELASSMVENIAINLDEIDDKIKFFTQNWEWDRISLVERNILRVAVYEMLFVMDVPPVVSINEAVAIARDYSNEKSCNFINGILNSVKDSLDRDGRTGAKN